MSFVSLLIFLWTTKGWASSFLDPSQSLSKANLQSAVNKWLADPQSDLRHIKSVLYLESVVNQTGPMVTPGDRPVFAMDRIEMVQGEILWTLNVPGTAALDIIEVELECPDGVISFTKDQGQDGSSQSRWVWRGEFLVDCRLAILRGNRPKWTSPFPLVSTLFSEGIEVKSLIRSDADNSLHFELKPTDAVDLGLPLSELALALKSPLAKTMSHSKLISDKSERTGVFSNADLTGDARFVAAQTVTFGTADLVLLITRQKQFKWPK